MGGVGVVTTEDGGNNHAGAFFIGYMAIWMSACLVAIGICIRNPGAFSLLRPEYQRFLLAPWKIATFAMATAGLTIIAPYSGDPTWDYVDALFMSILTFCGAPWVVGVIYLCARRRRSLTHLFVALCLGLFSVSWSYDFYILMRDGFYPATWFANIFASLSLYIPAGLLWNLDWRPNRGFCPGSRLLFSTGNIEGRGDWNTVRRRPAWRFMARGDDH